MLLGVEHIGVGVPDMDEALAFYAKLGFDRSDFDYTGPLPGLEAVAGRDVAEARVVHLRPSNPSALGLAGLRLVQVLDRDVPPLPEGIGWGEPGICEICVHARGQAKLYRELVDQHGATALMEPNVTETTPYGEKCDLSYVADPAGGKIELIEWLGLQDGWPTEEGAQGVNHVAFGVTDMERTRKFYEGLGFTGMLFDSNGYFEPMEPWYSGPAPKQHMVLMTNPHGGGIEPVQHDPPSADMHGEWGHAGPMDFGVGVTNLDAEIARLKDAGYEFATGPQEISDGTGTWRYAYVTEPDGNYVCLSESRF